MTRQLAARQLSQAILQLRAHHAAACVSIRGLSILGKAVLSGGTLIALVCVVGLFTPSRGRVIPVGPSVTEAYQLLVSSPSGRALVEDVRKALRGDIVYLTLGETERDRLSDHRGRPVRGVTRAIVRWNGRKFWTRTVTVIVNRDHTRTSPGAIVKSLAFELENVLHVYRNPATDGGIDSPRARLTQARILNELGIPR